MNLPHQQQIETAIGIEFAFTVFNTGAALSTSTLLRRFNLWVEIDGVRHEKEGGSWHVFEVSPGWHLVRVFFRQRPGILAPEVGAQQLQVEVKPGVLARLKYQAGLFWPFSGATLVQLG